MIQKVAEKLVANFNRLLGDKVSPSWPICPAVILSDGKSAVPVNLMIPSEVVGEDVVLWVVDQASKMAYLHRPAILGLLVVLGTELELPEDLGQLALLTFRRAFEGCDLGDPTLRTDYCMFLSDGETQLTYAAKVTRTECNDHAAKLGLISADDLPEFDMPHPTHFIMERLRNPAKEST